MYFERQWLPVQPTLNRNRHEAPVSTSVLGEVLGRPNYQIALSFDIAKRNVITQEGLNIRNLTMDLILESVHLAEKASISPTP